MTLKGNYGDSGFARISSSLDGAVRGKIRLVFVSHFNLVFDVVIDDVRVE